VRRETGKEQRVQVSYGEGSATHTGPESCVHSREGMGEALTGERMGQPSSRENIVSSVADMFHFMEGNTSRRAMRAPGRAGAVTDPGTCGRSLRGNREVSVSDPRPARRAGRWVRGRKARSRSDR
jgi:hypothetical protein